LLKKGANPDLEDEEGDTARGLAEENKAYKSVLESIMDSPLAISMTKSEVEKKEAQSAAQSEKKD